MSTVGKRRAYGQHFLKDRQVATLIATTALQKASELGCRSLLEIGPGKGAITVPLLENLGIGESSGHAPRLILCEKDREIAQGWIQKTREETDSNVNPLDVHEGDFLELPEALWLSWPPLAVVSNLPYSSGTAILDRLARRFREIPVMVLMFQAEVAKRLRAEPGTKEWGSLSVWIQNRWEVEKLVTAPPGAFSPPPQVFSEVVVLSRRSEPRIAIPKNDPDAEDRWESLLKTCFAHRRKMLRAGLPKSGLVQNALEVSGVDGTKRAEALEWKDWRNLYEAILRLRET